MGECIIMEPEQQGSVSQINGFAAWFARYALLFPIVVMASYYIGRGMGDSLQLIYVLSGLCSLRYMNFGEHKRILWVLVILLFFFSLSTFYPDFSVRSFKYWLLYALSGLVMVFTVGAVSNGVYLAGYRVMAFVPVALLIGLAIELSYFYFWAAEFYPAGQVNGMVLAALAPLVLLFTIDSKNSHWYLYLIFFSSAGVLLVVADSRTEVLMLIVSSGLFFALYYKKLFALITIAPLALITVVVADSYLSEEPIFAFTGNLYHWIDQISSSRLSIWVEALSHPPDNYLIGVGPHRSMEFLSTITYVKHLHNLFIEIWFEMGLFGLIAYLLLLYVLLSGVSLAYRSLEGTDRRVYAVFLASGVAAFIGAMLDKSYLHPLTRYYMLFCFTVLYLQHWKCRRDHAK